MDRPTTKADWDSEITTDKMGFNLFTITLEGEMSTITLTNWPIVCNCSKGYFIFGISAIWVRFQFFTETLSFNIFELQSIVFSPIMSQNFWKKRAGKPPRLGALVGWNFRTTLSNSMFISFVTLRGTNLVTAEVFALLGFADVNNSQKYLWKTSIICPHLQSKPPQN